MIATKRRPLRIANFLAPKMHPVYAAIAKHVSRRLNYPVELHTGDSYEQVHDQFDVCFICGLAYIELAEMPHPAIEPVAAPVLQGKRFAGKPIYYSDVIVRRDSSLQSFDDLRGRTWSYNEPFSQSGYGITRYRLAQMGEPHHFFGKVIRAGWHERSIDMVCAGEVDGSAIDCHVLAMALRERPDLRSKLRIIANLGPSTIQPVTVASHLSSRVKEELKRTFLEMANDPAMKRLLGRGLIERFVPINDTGYDDLRAMRQACQTAGCSLL